MQHDPTCRCPHGAFDPVAFNAAEAAFGRRSFLAGALAVLGMAALRPLCALAADTDVVVVRAARMFDGVRMHAPGLVVLKGSQIVSLMAGDAPSGATVIDLGDATIMPGLIDAHTHVSAPVVVSAFLMEGRRNNPADSVAEAALNSTRNAAAILANGFTTVRDVGGGNGIDLAMRNAIARGMVVGPRMLAAGPALSITGGHGDENDIPSFVDVHSEIESGVSFGPYGFRQKVREHVKRHVDLIKITSTGGVLSYGDVFDVPQFNLDEIQAIVDEATKFGLNVASHSHGDRGIAMAVEGGCHSIEHGTGVGEKTLAMMKERGTALVPTIWALDSILQPGNPNRIQANPLEKAHQAAKLRNEGMQRAIAANVKIVYGTDAGVFPHKENNKDFALLQSMGMHPLDLMASATSRAADLLGKNDRGRIAPGLLADIVAFAGDPSTNVALLETAPKLIVQGGKRIDPALLDVPAHG
jgi:imidazolonepropionase-like amidohydrolase